MEENDGKHGKSEPISIIKGLTDWWFSMVILGSISLMLGVVAFTYFYIQSTGFNNIVYLYIGAPLIIILVFLLWLNGVKSRTPEKILEILRYIRGRPE